MKLTALGGLADLSFDDVIDVRSEAEFALDHIPGAINLPVLNNAERAQVGFAYVQQSRFQARKMGAALVARNTAAHLQGPLLHKQGGWRPLVYCWRGGQRSGAFATILRQIGWQAELIDGGYQAYRRLVARFLYDQPLPFDLIVVAGGTGTGKTALLAAMARRGAQVIDLEALAQHRGSVFGAMPGGQPAQKMFESRLAAVLSVMDPARPVFIEAESNKIGRLLLPPQLWRAMQGAPQVTVQVPVAARAAFLVQSYAPVLGDGPRLMAMIDGLRPFHAKDQIHAWQAQAASGAFQDLAAGLIRLHYDPRYAKGRGGGRLLLALTLPDLSADTLELAAVRALGAMCSLAPADRR